jgi:dipeptide/tripeptide permease
MSIFYQIPQFIGIGLSEVFASVASLEFAYLTAPHSAQSLVMSLRFCSAGLSSFLGSAYINIYERFYEDFAVANSEVLDQTDCFLITISNF